LADEKGEELDVLAVEGVVHITQPFVFVLVVTLRLVTKEQHRAAAGAGGGLANAQRQAHAFGRIGASVRSVIAHGLQ
jgi:hypothetical protein